jgi:hypothetical protein
MKFIVEALHEDLNRIKIKPPSHNIEIPKKISGNLSAIVKFFMKI